MVGTAIRYALVVVRRAAIDTAAGFDSSAREGVA